MARKSPGQSEVCGSCARRPHPAPILPAAPRRSPPLSHRSRRERLTFPSVTAGGPGSYCWGALLATIPSPPRES